MQTRKDQLHAYRYLLRRVMSAMLGSDPEGPEQPMRRVMAATFSGVLVAVLAGAGVGLYGWLAGGSSTGWKEQGTLVIEEETGTRYLYLDKKLHRVVNYTSARLILGTEPTVESVSRESLGGVRRGSAVGILGAPDSLPDKDSVTSSPWAVCSHQQEAGGETNAQVDVLVGTEPADMSAKPVDDKAVVVSTGSRTYVIWHGKRLQTNSVALSSLHLSEAPALRVGTAWLDALPAGNPLVAPLTPTQETGTPVGGRQTYVGEVFEAKNVGTREQYFVMLDDGWAPIKETEANLILGQASATQSAPTTVSIADIHASERSQRTVTSPDIPRKPPQAADVNADPTAPVCAWQRAPGGKGEPAPDMRITTGGTLPAVQGTRPGGTTVGAVADHVRVPAGSIAVVGQQPAPDVDPTAFFLVTDAGVKFPVPSKDTLKALGYGGVDPVAVPDRLLDLIPLGPSLDPKDASEPAPIRRPEGSATPTPTPGS